MRGIFCILTVATTAAVTLFTPAFAAENQPAATKTVTGTAAFHGYNEEKPGSR